MKNKIKCQNFKNISLRILLASIPISIILSFTHKPLNIDNTYNELWEKVEKYEKEGLPKSALEVVDIIMNKANLEQNKPQVYKAYVHKCKFEIEINDNGLTHTLNSLKTEIDKSNIPLKQLFQSLYAEMFWNYYQQNFWTISNRTYTDVNNDDIETWDIRRIIENISKYYLFSVEPKDELQKEEISAYKEIIEIPENSNNLRTTLYDILAHRAIGFFTNAKTSLSSLQDSFIIDSPEFFSEASAFVQLDIKAQDEHSHLHKAFNLYQNLIKFYLNSNSIEALVDIDLMRLNFVREHSRNINSDNLYYYALVKLNEQFKHNEVLSIINFEIAQYLKSQGNLYNPNQASQYQFELQNAHALAQQTIQKFPNAKGVYNLKELIKEIEKRYFTFQIEQYVVPNTPILVKLNYRNIDTLYYKVIDAQNIDFDNNFYGKKDSAKVHFLNSFTPLFYNSVKLINEHDFQEHSSEIALEKLSTGKYIVIFSPNKDFKYENNKIDYLLIQATNLSYISQSNDNMHFYYIANRETGTPLSKVKADLYQYDYNYKTHKYSSNLIKTFKSDKNGEVHISAPISNKNTYIVFSQGKDTLTTSKNYHYSSNSKIKDKKIKTVFFTDRAIYRPGQTLYFKGIVIETDGESSSIKTNYSTTIYLYDVNYEKKAEIKVRTNEFGSFNGAFVIPETGLTGEMSIAEQYGTHYFLVEEYKRPSFEVTFNETEQYYKLNQKVEISGNAKAFAGFPIDGANVEYKVVRKVYYPFWRYWMWQMPSSSETIIDNGTLVTNKNGEFSFSFIASPDLDIKNSFSHIFVYTIYADITDINGETRTNSKSIYIGEKAMLLSTNIDEFFDVQAENKIEIYSTNLNGTPIETQVEVEIYQVQAPQSFFISRLWEVPDKPLMSKENFSKLFPNIPYKNEDTPNAWKKKQQVFKTTIKTENEQKLQIPDIQKWNAGVYYIRLSSTDPFGEKVEYEHFFKVFKPESKNADYNSPFWVQTKKTKGEPGEFAIINIGSSVSNSHAIISIEHKQKIISKQWYKIGKGFKTIEIPIEEKHRGGFQVHIAMISNNRTYVQKISIDVPHTNKEIDIKFETFREKLQPGQQETWNIILKDKNGEKVMAEMLAVLYDASLDIFKKHFWSLMLNYTDYASLQYSASESFVSYSGIGIANKWNPQISFNFQQYEKLKTYNLTYFNYPIFRGNRNTRSIAYSTAALAEENFSVNKNIEQTESDKVFNQETGSKEDFQQSADIQFDDVVIRGDFNETAFFYPDLRTNENGEIVISFTLPESLTKWRMLGLAHTKDLKVGDCVNELVAQKELMITPNLPRFFREGDTIIVQSKITNLSETLQSGKAKLTILDALTQKPIDVKFDNANSEKQFSVEANSSTNVSWKIMIPSGIQAITCKIVAVTDKFSDGEEHILPILTNDILITESLPLFIRSKQTKEFEHNKLTKSEFSNTLKHHKLTLEFSANPAWYAVQAIPYMMEYQHECSEQIFTKLYANTLSKFIVESKPQIKKVFDVWRNISNSEILISNLEKNQELKQILLEETPWVIEAADETERKKRIALLFDINTMSKEYERTLYKLETMQNPDGAWAWFDGLPVSRFITQYISSGFGHLAHLQAINLKKDVRLRKMMQSSINFLDTEIANEYNKLKNDYSAKELDELKPSIIVIHYLYTRSFFLNDFNIPSNTQEAVDYYKKQLTKYWLGSGLYGEGMAALALHRMGDKETPKKILKSLKERAIISDELGMYWKENTSGYSWWQAHIETQSLLIEAFYEIARDTAIVDNLKTWLLKQKQVQDWKTTKATANAVYALLLTGSDWLSVEPDVDITIGDEVIDVKHKAERGIGYINISWKDNEIKPKMGKVKVSKHDEGISWGALYWQYFEKLDKVSSHKTQLSIEKKLFVEKTTPQGKELKSVQKDDTIHIGEKVIVRLVIRVDRDMEYVHIKDMRASGFEPINVISQYKWQDGLWYYESTRDVATNFFADYLRKGTYIFEYPLRATVSGNFSNGITTIQCMYAPEFISHSEGIRVKIIE